MRDRSSYQARRKKERIAFSVIKGLSFLTIAVLALIVGFILYRGLRYSAITRSQVLPWAETSPDGLSVVVNADSEVKVLDYPALRGIYTDAYIDWSKIDSEDSELVPVAVDPALPGGAAAAALVFGRGAEAAWGGLVVIAPSEREAIDKVAAAKGAVAVVSSRTAREAIGRKAAIRIVPLRRLALAANSGALALVDNRQVEDVDDAAISRLVSGGARYWKEFGGPDLGVAVLAPPAGTALAAQVAAAGYRPAGGAGAGPAGLAPDMDAYLASIRRTPGAVGFAFAEDVAAANEKAAAAADAAAATTATAAAAGSAAVDPAVDPGDIGLLTRRGVERGWNIGLGFLFQAPKLSGRVGGISSIILNTFYMLALTILLAVPLGVAAAVYLIEYARQGFLLSILRLGTETLAGIPSIIFGLFGMLVFVDKLHFGFGLLSGCATITLMILPTIIRTSEEALKSVPRSLREGSLALGATKLKTIGRVVIPAAAPGIMTGVGLAIGRAVGETAALLFTMGSDYKAASGLFSSARVLSAHIYLLFAEGISFDKAFSTATVLIVVVLGFNFLSKRLMRRMNRASGVE